MVTLKLKGIENIFCENSINAGLTGKYTGRYKANQINFQQKKYVIHIYFIKCIKSDG